VRALREREHLSHARLFEENKSLKLQLEDAKRAVATADHFATRALRQSDVDAELSDLRFELDKARRGKKEAEEALARERKKAKNDAQLQASLESARDDVQELSNKLEVPSNNP
jgi:hypothetical protein